jgi:four helix bundle protein
MTLDALALQHRTHRFFTRVIRFCETLPENRITAGIGEQLADSAGSADGNYRSACRTASPEECIAKLGAAAAEVDESKGWLSALLSREYGDSDETRMLFQEAHELSAIFTASRNTARRQLAERRLEPIQERC